LGVIFMAFMAFMVFIATFIFFIGRPLLLGLAARFIPFIAFIGAILGSVGRLEAWLTSKRLTHVAV